MLGKDTTYSSGGHRRIRDERHRRGVVDARIQSQRGPDLSQSETTCAGEELGGRIAIGHREANIGEAQVVVISSAVAATNPEGGGGKARQIPVIRALKCWPN